jgi:hypothetical protein
VTAGALHLGATEAAISGYHAAFLIGAGFMTLASLAAFFVIRDPQKSDADSREALRNPQLQSSLNH